MSNLILKAAKFASNIHNGQVLKYTNEPYINHLLRVSGRVSILEYATEDMICAAWLHDAVEDHPDKCSIKTIDIEFNEIIGNLVFHLTNVFNKKDYPNLNRDSRKAREFKRISVIPNEAKIIKLIDRIDNLSNIPMDDFLKVYLKETDQLLDILQDVDSSLEKELKDLIIIKENYRHPLATLLKDKQIDISPCKLGGKPCLKGHRISVGQLIAELVDEADDQIKYIANDFDLDIAELKQMYNDVSCFYNQYWGSIQKNPEIKFNEIKAMK